MQPPSQPPVGSGARGHDPAVRVEHALLKIVDCVRDREREGVCRWEEEKEKERIIRL